MTKGELNFSTLVPSSIEGGIWVIFFYTVSVSLTLFRRTSFFFLYPSLSFTRWCKDFRSFLVQRSRNLPFLTSESRRRTLTRKCRGRGREALESKRPQGENVLFSEYKCRRTIKVGYWTDILFLRRIKLNRDTKTVLFTKYFYN